MFMIIGGFAVGVRILLEKGPSRDHILKIRKILEKYQEIIFSQKTQEAYVRPPWPTSGLAPSRTSSSPKT
jgi:hypothetical protein